MAAADADPGADADGIAEAIAIVEALGVSTAGLSLDAATLSSLAADLVLAQGAVFDLADVAAQVGASEAAVTRIYRGMGVGLIDGPQFDAADVAFVQTIVDAPTDWIDQAGVIEVLRVLGRSMATAAEAAIGYHLTAIEPRARSANDWTRANTEMAELALQLANDLGSVFRHHMRQVIDVQRVSFVEDHESGEVIQLAIGFVDLSGFTTTTDQSDLAATAALVKQLETIASRVASEYGCRVVKFIGDEVMFAGTSAAGLATAAVALVSEMAADGVLAHGGIGFGRVVMMHGDYFGPVVNMAARLAAAAEPGQLLTDAQTAVAFDVPTVTLGPRQLRGFADTIVVHAIA